MESSRELTSDNSAVDTAIPVSQTAESSIAAVTQPLSKNAQKRLAKAARLAEVKKERRAAEKERRKERKRLQAQKRAAGELDSDETADAESRKKRKVEEQKGPRVPFGARVVVDLGFDDMMTENVRHVKYLIGGERLMLVSCTHRKSSHSRLNWRILTVQIAELLRHSRRYYSRVSMAGPSIVWKI